jgi:hypothetical protein
MAGKFVTWLGNDELHYTESEDENGIVEKSPSPGPSFMFWDRIRFDKDKPVLIDPDQEGIPPTLKETFKHILAKAVQNKYFKVDEVLENEPEEGEGGDHKPRIQPHPKRKR